jgi:hypothetical protein
MWMDNIDPKVRMSKRINIVLPEATIQAIDRMANPGKRSLFINQAVQHFISHRSTEALRTQLELAAVRDRDLDREIAADWFAADEEAWQTLHTQELKKIATRGAAKSTSRRSIRPSGAKSGKLVLR